MSEAESGQGGVQNARRQIIEEAQLRCHIHRSELQQLSKLQDGSVPREVLMRFQQSVTDYYWALRPLRSEAIVEEFWGSVKLSESWTYTDTEVREGVQADLYGPIRVVEKPVAVEKPYTGLEAIKDHLDGEFEEETIVKTGARGRREETVRRKKLLDPAALIDISGILDDVAAKLGFMPDVKTKDPKDSPNMGDLRGLLVDRGQVEAAEKLPNRGDD